MSSELGTALEEADLVLVGAELVVENGGIISRLIFSWINYYLFYLQVDWNLYSCSLSKSLKK